MDILSQSSILCISSRAGQQEKALRLSKKYNIPLVTEDRGKKGIQLIFTDTRLELHTKSDDMVSKDWIMSIDFVGGSSGYRRKFNNSIKQPIARAIGIKSGFRPTVIDATAGLGEDAFVFASLGCHVTLLERSPIIASLLQDAIERAFAEESTREILNDNMILHVGNSLELLKKISPSPYTIYLDPMYPHKKKSSLNKKEMRMIRKIVGDDHDADLLFQAAIKFALNRVVVKRPKGAPTISVFSPSHSIEMKNSRFDVYLTNHL